MKLEKISFNYSVEKLRGIKVHSPEVYENLETHLAEGMDKIYRRHVPKSTRMYIEAMLAAEENVPGKGGNK
ncbi:MAG: hypothetical protein IJA80_02290 [Clostridia bacterium]|nr:hypothetical protein [Clostridia bacterium]MBQ6887878.1 hypothetical protein [Lachnospiraceae bacterium]MBQ8767594.1 hypothetical protein [Clostridia bacterium]MBR6647742.1 hypothetical protein [Clostridia bacterium]